MPCPNCGFTYDYETGEVYDPTFPCPLCGMGGARVTSIEDRVASRHVAGFFNVGDIILYGKYKNKLGRVVRLFTDDKGHPAVEIEPIPKGRKQNKIFGLFKMWKATPEQLVQFKAQGKIAAPATR